MISNEPTKLIAVPDRWLTQGADKVDLDTRLSLVQKSFRHYKFNMYLLNHMALKIQHWFFVRNKKSVS